MIQIFLTAMLLSLKNNLTYENDFFKGSLFKSLKQALNNLPHKNRQVSDKDLKNKNDVNFIEMINKDDANKIIQKIISDHYLVKNQRSAELIKSLFDQDNKIGIFTKSHLN